MPIKITQTTRNKYINDTTNTIIDFSAKWCAPCRAMKPFFDGAEKFMETTNTKLVFGTIDVDEESKMASEFEIKSMPTLILIKNGVEIDRSVGYKKMNDILMFIGKHFNVTEKLVDDVSQTNIQLPKVVNNIKSHNKNDNVVVNTSE